jgi:hypothetical protein
MARLSASACDKLTLYEQHGATREQDALARDPHADRAAPRRSLISLKLAFFGSFAPVRGQRAMCRSAGQANGRQTAAGLPEKGRSVNASTT